jgi:hypothetical protein
VGEVILFTAREAGSRIASRVVVAAPQGSCFDGERGTVVRAVPGTTTLIVRLERGVELPFDRSEVVVKA